MNTPTKRIFYLFGAKFAKNEPQTKVWGSLTCKPQFSQPFAAAFAAGCARSRCSRWSRVFALVAASCARVRAGRTTSAPARTRAAVLLDAGLLLGALDSSHLLLGKPNGTVIFSVVRSGTTMIAQVGTSCFQRRHVV